MARFRRKPVIREAVRALGRQWVPTAPEGVLLIADKGDWIITEGDGYTSVLTDKLFRESHEPTDIVSQSLWDEDIEGDRA